MQSSREMTASFHTAVYLTGINMLIKKYIITVAMHQKKNTIWHALNHDNHLKNHTIWQALK